MRWIGITSVQTIFSASALFAFRERESYPASQTGQIFTERGEFRADKISVTLLFRFL
jgi:hypothetical protein